MKTVTVALTILFTFVLASSALAQADKTQQMIDELQSKTQGVTSYKVDIKSETEAAGQNITSQGTMEFKQPNMIRISTTANVMGGMKQEVYSKDDVMWTYMPKMRMASKIDMAKVKAEAPRKDTGMTETTNLTRPFQGFPKDAVRFMEKKKAEGREVYIFEAYPGKMSPPPAQAGPQMMPKKIIFWITADTGLPYKVIMVGENGATIMQQTYSNYQINVPIPNSDFEFTPPQGAQVMDMTDATIRMMKGEQPAPPQGGYPQGPAGPSGEYPPGPPPAPPSGY